MVLREQENVQTRNDKICTTESQRELERGMRGRKWGENEDISWSGIVQKVRGKKAMIFEKQTAT